MVQPIYVGDSKEAIEKVVKISRVAKVTKGGTKLSFTALVVVGDAKGNVGYALGQAAEVAVAIKKGRNAAMRMPGSLDRMAMGNMRSAFHQLTDRMAFFFSSRNWA